MHQAKLRRHEAYVVHDMQKRCINSVRVLLINDKVQFLFELYGRGYMTGDH